MKEHWGISRDEFFTCDDCGALRIDDRLGCSETGTCEKCTDIYRSEMEKKFGWMRRYVKDAVQADREGDHSTASAIRFLCGVGPDPRDM